MMICKNIILSGAISLSLLLAACSSGESADTPCVPNPCQHDGTCLEVDGTYSCTCQAGYEGDNCEISSDHPCDPNPCQHGGTCMEDESSFSCDCPDGYTGDRCEQADNPYIQGTMGDSARVIFLHHSTGGVIYNDGSVANWFDTYNTDNQTHYVIEEMAYPDDPYPWANYPYDYWHLWIDNGGQATSEGVDTLEQITQGHEVIVFKHCFPVSGIGPDTGSPDISSDSKRIENYKLQYEAIKTKLHTFKNKRFIVWTGAALVESATNPDNAERSREFFTWVKNEWDEKGDNIFVWDFFELETEGGNYLLDDYSEGGGDSHPNADFAATVGPLFSKRIVDVLEGAGDTGGLTGE